MDQNRSCFLSLFSHKHKRDEVLRDLPYDVVINILTRLPSKTLIRFRCVCKSWCDIINDSSFIIMHINQSIKFRFHNYSCQNSKGHLIELKSKPNHEYHRPGHPMSHDDIIFVEHEKRELPIIIVSTTHITIVGSCNGLICFLSYAFAISERFIYLWNPSIRKLKALPSPHIHPCNGLSAMFTEKLGFGFDSRTNDFKVVRFLYLEDNYTHEFNVCPCEIEVYSLSTNSWKRIATTVPCFTNDIRSHAFVNGNFHWKARKEGLKGMLIMSFDFANEVFTEILPPNTYIGEQEQQDFFCIAEFQKSLSLLSWPYSKPNKWTMSTCCVWVMKEYGMTESWTKHFTISLQSIENVRKPVGIAMNGEVLLRKHDGNLVSYDPETQQINDLGIRVFHAFIYVGSLALLKERRKEGQRRWQLGDGCGWLIREDDGFESIC